jgi:carboxyl-terminal processing protease
MRARVAVLLGLLGALLLGMWLGGHSAMLPGPLRDLVRDDDLAVIDAAVEHVKDAYIREVPEDELADDAVRGIIEGLDDRFSAYFDPEQYERFRERSHARFSGVGLGVQAVDAGLRVTRVYEDSPAERAGLRVGDVIVAADGSRLAGRPVEAATGLIKGRPGTQVTLTVRRGDERFTRRVTRAEVAIPVVSTALRRRGGRTYAVVRLETFSSGAHGELYDAVRRALRRKVAGIVLDLRGNGGGLVEEARLVASAFIAEGEIVRTEGRAVRPRVYSATGDPVAPRTPLVVLVDRGTASAAEIVAGALQDRDRATVVGTRTFGKGVFQQIIELDNGGALDLTVGQYFLPSGRNLGGKGTETGDGLRPDVPARDDPSTPADEALDRALRELASSGT